MADMDDELKLTLWENIKFTISDFINDWIYPAYYLKNMLFKRYDLVRLPYKSWHYVEPMYRMFDANMCLIKEFIEKENPEEYVVWYGNEGHKYGEIEGKKILYPELKGKYIMDIIKDIYNWYTVTKKIEDNDLAYLTHIWAEYFFKCSWDETNDIDPIDHEPLYEMKPQDLNYSVEEGDKLNLDWNIINKYFNCTKEEFYANKDNFIHKRINEIEKELNEKMQYYLHLCIEVREYLWI